MKVYVLRSIDHIKYIEKDGKYIVFKNRKDAVDYNAKYCNYDYYVDEVYVDCRYGKIKNNTIYTDKIYYGYDYKYDTLQIYDVIRIGKLYSCVTGLKSESELFREAQIIRNNSKDEYETGYNYIWLSDRMNSKGYFYDDSFAGKIKYDIIPVVIV